MVEWRVHRGTTAKFQALRAGFLEFIPEDALGEFTERELQV
jgi:hypothetical protein